MSGAMAEPARSVHPFTLRQHPCRATEESSPRHGNVREIKWPKVRVVQNDEFSRDMRAARSSLLVFNADFCADFSQSLFSSRALTARRYSPSVTGRRAMSPRKVAAIPVVTTHGSSARSATLTEHGATRIPELLRRLRRRGKCAWGSRDGIHRLPETVQSKSHFGTF